jgi:hypothetical protein
MPKKETEFPEVLGLRVNTETLKKLGAMAKAELRPVASMARIVLMEGLAAREKKTAKKKKPA